MGDRDELIYLIFTASIYEYLSILFIVFPRVWDWASWKIGHYQNPWHDQAQLFFVRFY